MSNSDKIMSRRELRRMKNGKNRESEDNRATAVEHKNEEKWKVTEEGSRMIVQRTTSTVKRQDTPFAIPQGGLQSPKEEVGSLNAQEIISSDSDTRDVTHTIDIDNLFSESKNLTYDFVGMDNHSVEDTYNIVRKPYVDDCIRPVPAPRRQQTIIKKGSEKQSSDTDRDVTDIEIEADENTVEWKQDDSRKTIFSMHFKTQEDAPIPKPRTFSSRSTVQQALIRNSDSLSRSKSLEEICVRALSSRSIKSNPEIVNRPVSVDDAPSDEKSSKSVTSKMNRTGKLVGFLRRKKQKKASNMSSVIKMQRHRVPTISSIMSNLKEDVAKCKLEKGEGEEEEDKTDYQLDSPRFPQSQQNDKLYIQSRNGFYIKTRGDVFGQDDKLRLRTKETEKMDESITSRMIKTATLFQKYWSRFMIYFHGVLAGLGLSHAFTVTAVMLYLNDDAQKFVDIYSCLALKIHFIFYSLNALCIISCLDRLDIGNLNKTHWQKICRNCLSLWFILFVYITGFVLTFVNHSTEAMFDSYKYGNITGDSFWDAHINRDVPGILSRWYGIIWARNIILSKAWLLISLTEYPDNLQTYVIDLNNKAHIGMEN